MWARPRSLTSFHGVARTQVREFQVRNSPLPRRLACIQLSSNSPLHPPDSKATDRGQRTDDRLHWQLAIPQGQGIGDSKREWEMEFWVPWGGIWVPGGSWGSEKKGKKNEGIVGQDGGKKAGNEWGETEDEEKEGRVAWSPPQHIPLPCHTGWEPHGYHIETVHSLVCLRARTASSLSEGDDQWCCWFYLSGFRYMIPTQWAAPWTFQSFFHLSSDPKKWPPNLDTDFV